MNESEKLRDSQRKSGKKLVVGAFALLIPIAAGAIYMATRSAGSSDGAAPPNATPAAAESATVQPPPVVAAALPAAVTESVAAAAKVDSQVVADSLKAAKRAVAKADSLKKAGAKADSLKRVHATNRTKARSAAIWLFADPTARNTFMDGATHMGGVLGKKRMGDLQTQINALQPFLARAGLTYAQFKDVMQQSGIKVYDEFGRIMPDSLRKFTGVSKL